MKVTEGFRIYVEEPLPLFDGREQYAEARASMERAPTCTAERCERRTSIEAMQKPCAHCDQVQGASVADFKAAIHGESFSGEPTKSQERRSPGDDDSGAGQFTIHEIDPDFARALRGRPPLTVSERVAHAGRIERAARRNPFRLAIRAG